MSHPEKDLTFWLLRDRSDMNFDVKKNKKKPMDKELWQMFEKKILLTEGTVDKYYIFWSIRIGLFRLFYSKTLQRRNRQRNRSGRSVYKLRSSKTDKESNCKNESRKPLQQFHCTLLRHSGKMTQWLEYPVWKQFDQRIVSYNEDEKNEDIIPSDVKWHDRNIQQVTYEHVRESGKQNKIGKRISLLPFIHTTAQNMTILVIPPFKLMLGR